MKAVFNISDISRFRAGSTMEIHHCKAPTSISGIEQSKWVRANPQETLQA
ncbi:hypothetical protein [Paraburkholderia sp. MM5477-R1]